MRTYPALQVIQRNFAHCLYPGLTLIERWDVMEFATAIADKNSFTFDGDFFQRFQAIAAETGTNNIYTLEFLFAKLLQGRRQVGL